MVTQMDLDTLAERIRTGVVKRGVHLVLGDELSLIFNRQETKPGHEKFMLIKNFASHYGLDALVSNSLRIAVFKKG